MKPDVNVKLYAVENDTIPLSMILSYQSDTGTVIVADTWTVTMHIDTGGPALQIIGVPLGNGSGTFKFPVTQLANKSGKFTFDVDVHDGTYLFTVARGQLLIAEEV